MDLYGSGRYTKPLQGSNPSFVPARYLANNGSGQHKWPAYWGYQHNAQIGLYSNPGTQFLLQANSTRYDVDEPAETILEPEYVRSDLDSTFGAGENATLHLPQADQDLLGLSGRAQDLAPINFNGTNIAAVEARRRMYTTTSWDLKSFTATSYQTTTTPPVSARAWETSTNYVQLQSALRPALQQLLYRQYAGTNVTASQASVARRLSPNQLCVIENGTGNVVFRPLTPHPDANGPYGQLGSSPVNQNLIGVLSPNSTPANIKSAADQEYFARRDRQQLCRDIYTLMYLYCGGNDNLNYAKNNPYVLDTDGDNIPDALKDMAQFAVNLVDRMDPDNVVTMFEFDINLADGWNLDDDPYTNSLNSPTKASLITDVANVGSATGERAVVYGVEEQELALNEAQIIFAKRVLDPASNPVNHAGTEYNDTMNRDFTFIELENVSPRSISFQNENWQIAVKPPVTTTTTMGSTPSPELNAG